MNLEITILAFGKRRWNKKQNPEETPRGFVGVHSNKIEPLFYIKYPKVLAWVRRKIEENIAEYRRILRDGIHVGYYRLAPDDDGRELDDLYIFPEFQNRGIGTAVIRQCCAQGPVNLYVFTKNTGALALYRRLGFREIRQVGAPTVTPSTLPSLLTATRYHTV